MLNEAIFFIILFSADVLCFSFSCGNDCGRIKMLVASDTGDGADRVASRVLGHRRVLLSGVGVLL